MAQKIQYGISTLGHNQEDLVNFLSNVLDIVNELQADHATSKTSHDAMETLIEELHDDHATFKAAVDATETLIEELHDDHATNIAAINSQKSVMGDMSLSPAGLAIGSGSKKKVLIANTVTFLVGGLFKSKTTAEIDFTATTHDVAAGSNAFFVLSLDASGTCTITKGADGAALSTITVPASNSVIGYLNIAAAGTPFDATTDDLDAVHLTVTYTDASYLEQQISAPAATLTASKPASGPATLTSPKPASGPATLTNSTALTLDRNI